MELESDYMAAQDDGAGHEAANAIKGRRRRDPIGPLRQLALFARSTLLRARHVYLCKICKMDVHPNTKISLKAHLDFTNPRGVHIDSGTLISFHATILTHDLTRVLHTDTYVGKNCFVGAFAIIMPGVRVGDGCIVGSGAVVTKDLPPNSIAVGNPAKIIRSGITTKAWGVLEDAVTENEALKALYKGDWA